MPEASFKRKTADLLAAAYQGLDYLKMGGKRRLFFPKSFFLMLHKRLLAHNPTKAGRYRTALDRIYVSGATFVYAEPSRIEDKLVELQDFINNRRKWWPVFNREILKKIGTDGLEENELKLLYRVYIAWYIHHRFVVIHPFADGNGRMARLIMCIILRTTGLIHESYPPLINTIINGDKPSYLRALSSMDNGRHPEALFYVMRVMRDAYRLASQQR